MLPSITKNSIYRLGIDIDNTVANFIGRAEEIVERETGQKANLAYRWGSKLPLIDGVAVADLIYKQKHLEIMETAEIYPDVKAAIDRLNEHYFVYFVTARPIAAKDLTLQWLMDHKLMSLPQYLVFANDKMKAPVQYLVDDDVRQVDNCIRYGRYGILMGRHEYNLVWKNRVRVFVKDMTEAADHLIKLRTK